MTKVNSPLSKYLLVLGASILLLRLHGVVRR